MRGFVNRYPIFFDLKHFIIITIICNRNVTYVLVMENILW